MSLEKKLLRKFMPSKTISKTKQPIEYKQEPISQSLYKIFAKYPEISPKKGVIHVGAHRCEETNLYSSLGIPEDHMLWIDGNDDLCRQFPQIINAVISDTDDADVEFIITNNDAMSSSILELKEHKIEHPDCKESKRVSKKTVTLDTLFDRLKVHHDAYDFLVLDLQGAELLALKGATQILPSINCIFTEVSTKELYTDCVLIQDLDVYLGTHGFIRVATDMTRHGWGDAIYIRNLHSIETKFQRTTVTVEVNSGLGNRLFQLAFLYGISKDHGVKSLLARNLIKPCSQHFKDQHRYDSFYQMFDMVTNVNISNADIILEPKNTPCLFVPYDKEHFYVSDSDLHIFNGYFQSEKYFIKYKDDIIEHFTSVLQKTSSHMTSKYPQLQSENNCMFIHVRGSDHVASNNPMHHMAQINNYYETCLSKISDNTQFCIFTDDLGYLGSLKFVNKLTNYTIIDENELDTLYLMSKCSAGGICTNSSFSWWGSYLNTNPQKKVFMPFPFLNGANTQYDDIYYNGVYKIKIDEHSVFDYIVNTRFVDDEVIITMVQKQDSPLDIVLINNKIAKVRKMDKSVHNDIYSTFIVITSTNPQWKKESTLKFTLSINGVERDYTAKKSITQKMDIVAMTMFKNDVELINSYVTYYKKMGVDHFYMYYNDVKPIQSLYQHPNITYIQWNYPYYVGDKHYAQIGALTDFLYWSKHFAKYVLFNDMDEYIFWKGPTNLTLKQFVLKNKFPCYGFLNNFVYIKNKDTEIEACECLNEYIDNNEFTKTSKVYNWGARSKFIIDPNQYDAIGVHKIIVPVDIPKCVFGFETAGIYHVCNIKNRNHVSISKECLEKI